jgi:hypothetical protein
MILHQHPGAHAADFQHVRHFREHRLDLAAHRIDALENSSSSPSSVTIRPSFVAMGKGSAVP